MVGKGKIGRSYRIATESYLVVEPTLVIDNLVKQFCHNGEGFRHRVHQTMVKWEMREQNEEITSSPTTIEICLVLLL